MSDQISALSALSNDSNLANGGTISNTEHNTHRTNYRTQINNHRDVLISLEKSYASTSEPTDTPEGKLYCDTTNDPAQLKYYHDGSGNLSTLIADRGTVTTAAYTTNGVHLKVAAGTITDSSSSGTVAKNAVNAIGIPTLAATSATTYTENATLYIAGAPVDSTNVTTTTPYALWVDSGNVKFDGNLTVGGTATVTGGFTFDSDLDLNGNNIDDAGVIFLKEQAEADADVAGYGQLWVDTATPNVLMFTDDAGTDFTIAHNATTTLSSLVTVGALNSGSITSGFGAIDVGSSNIDGGTITAATALAGTLSTAAQPNVTTAANLVTVGALNSGSITSGFGNIDIGASTFTTTGTLGAGATTVTTSAAQALSVAQSSGTTDIYAKISNTTGTLFAGVESSTGASVLAGTSAYDAVLFTSAAKNLHLGTNSAIALTIDSSQNVGIGTSSPDTTLDVSGTSGVVALQVEQATNDGTVAGIHIYKNRGAGNAATGLCGSLDFYALDTANNKQRYGYIAGSADTVTSTAEDGSLAFYTTNSGTETLALTINSSQAIQFNAYGAGTLVTDASGNITASSDESLKTNLVDFTKGVSALIGITPKTYNWTEESGLDQENSYTGITAQNVEASIPEAVYSVEGKPKTVMDRTLIATLINAVKELNTRLEALEGA